MQSLWEVIVNSPTISTCLIVVGSIISAYLVRLITTRVLLSLASKTKTNLDDQIVHATSKPLLMSVILIGLGFAIRQIPFMQEYVQVADSVLLTLGVLLWTGGGMNVVRAILKAIAASSDEGRFVRPQSVPIFEILFKTIIVGGAAYGILLIWKVDVTAWLASAGILGIAVGFAAKDTLSNFFSGIFIIADAPYKIGDFINLDSGERGQVTDIGIRSTRLLTRDDIQIIMPNAAIANTKIVNESGGPHVRARVRIDVGVAYGSDIDQVKEALMDIASKSSYLISHPEPRVRFRELGESSLKFQLLGWIAEPILRGRAIDELNSAVYKRFAAEGIAIPFPQRDLHIYNS